MHHGTVDKKIAMGLKVLKDRITSAQIPPSKLDESILLATWNVREFGKRPRLDSSIHYIAEVIGQFDLVALAEVRDNLSDLARVLPILGPYWKVVFSDYMTDPGGNRERIAYVYDKRAVSFTGLAAEASPRRTKRGTEYLPEKTWWRAPYMASFRAGNFDFVLIAVHIRWGKSEANRTQELQMLADWIDQRRKEPFVFDKDIIVLGDFNIPDTEGPLFKAITSRGLRMPTALQGTTHGSNLAKNKRYDQILHYPLYSNLFTNAGGILDFYQGDHKSLYPEQDLNLHKFTFELSDHLPLWIRIDTDIDDMKLDQILKQRK